MTIFNSQDPPDQAVGEHPDQSTMLDPAAGGSAAPVRANGWEATSGFVDDPTLHDGNNNPSLSNTGAGTGYVRNVAGMAAITVILYLGETPPSVYDVNLIYGYQDHPNYRLDVSNDAVNWTSQTGGGTFPSPALCTPQTAFKMFVLPAPGPYKYLRVCVSDQDFDGCGGARAAVYEVWA